MTTFWRFLCYRLKSGALRTVIIAVLAIIIDRISLEGSGRFRQPEYIDNNRCCIYMLATLLCIVASLVPVLELSGLKNRRNLDTLYFFPIRREKMALVYFVSSFVQIVVIYTAAFLVHFVYLATNTDWFALAYMFPYYFLSLLLALVICAVYMFIFTQANTVVDGLVFCVFWIFFLGIVSGTLLDVSAPWIFGEEYRKDEAYKVLAKLPVWGILYTPMNNLTVLYQDLIEINAPNKWNNAVEQIMVHFRMFFVWGVLGLAAAFGYVASFVKKGAEQAGEISKSWFGYKILIPVCGYSFVFMASGPYGIDLIPLLLYAIMMTIGYIIYRRGFKFKLSDILLTVGGIVPVLLTNWL